MKTLVIHPSDPSTDFLKRIYADRECTVLTHGALQAVAEQMACHERIMAMGHGSPEGLFAVGQFGDQEYVVDMRMRKLLKTRLNAFIWCHAFDFLSDMRLTGFATGMFISESAEARVFGLYADQAEIDHSNNHFSELAAEYLWKDGRTFDSYSNLISRYQAAGAPLPNTGVIGFNRKRMGFARFPTTE